MISLTIRLFHPYRPPNQFTLSLSLPLSAKPQHKTRIALQTKLPIMTTTEVVGYYYFNGKDGN